MSQVWRPHVFHRYLNRVLFWNANRLESKRKFASAHRLLLNSAKYGNVEAAFKVGENYAKGIGCAKSGSEALYWYLIAAEANHRDAQFEAGIIFLSDHDFAWGAGASARWAMAAMQLSDATPEVIFRGRPSLTKNDELAYLWLGRSARAGKPEAQANFGWMLFKGVGCDRDLDGALNWFRRADSHNINQASLGLAYVYGDRSFSGYDTDEQLRWLRRSSDLGNISASYQYATLMRKLRSQTENADDVVPYLKKAARGGHVAASFDLGLLLIADAKEESEIERGINLIRTAGKLGEIAACAALGEIYSQGRYLKVDLRESAQWYRKAADGGHIPSQFHIGCLFARGEGVPKDLKHAANYFAKCADKGHAVGAFNLAVFYERGDGVDVNLDNAEKYFRIAANNGLIQARVRLAQLLNSGKLGVRDTEQASALLSVAIQHNNADAEYSLALILLENRTDEKSRQALKLLSNATLKGHLGAAELLLASSSLSETIDAIPIAIELIARAADAGSTRALLCLASELMSGRYISPDLQRAEEYLIKAAETKDPSALFELGVFYCKRKRDRADIESGLSFYLAAAELGHVVAQFNAGLMLLRGVSGQVDITRATKLLSDASAQGLEEARVALSGLDITNDGNSAL